MTSGIIKKCLDMCELSTYKVRIGCVIFKGKRILSYGFNGLRSSNLNPKYKNFENSIHAEQHAMLNVNWNTLKGASILIMRISKKERQLGNAQPCEMCMKMINHVGIKNIYYTDKYGQINKVEKRKL